jgi:xanthine dehydrogenase accessory factor
MSNPHEEILETMARLIRMEEPFALSTVIRTVAASAAKPGAKALIRSDGSMIGWIGGGCTRAAVEQAARRTLAMARPPDSTLAPSRQRRSPSQSSPTSCVSGGVVRVRRSAKQA